MYMNGPTPSVAVFGVLQRENGTSYQLTKLRTIIGTDRSVADVTLDNDNDDEKIRLIDESGGEQASSISIFQICFEPAAAKSFAQYSLARRIRYIPFLKRYKMPDVDSSSSVFDLFAIYVNNRPMMNDSIELNDGDFIRIHSTILRDENRKSCIFRFQSLPIAAASFHRCAYPVPKIVSSADKKNEPQKSERYKSANYRAVPIVNTNIVKSRSINKHITPRGGQTIYSASAPPQSKRKLFNTKSQSFTLTSKQRNVRTPQQQQQKQQQQKLSSLPKTYSRIINGTKFSDTGKTDDAKSENDKNWTCTPPPPSLFQSTPRIRDILSENVLRLPKARFSPSMKKHFDYLCAKYSVVFRSPMQWKQQQTQQIDNEASDVNKNFAINEAVIDKVDNQSVDPDLATNQMDLVVTNHQSKIVAQKKIHCDDINQITFFVTNSAKDNVAADSNSFDSATTCEMGVAMVNQDEIIDSRQIDKIEMNPLNSVASGDLDSSSSNQDESGVEAANHIVDVEAKNVCAEVTSQLDDYINNHSPTQTDTCEINRKVRQQQEKEMAKTDLQKHLTDNNMEQIDDDDNHHRSEHFEGKEASPIKAFEMIRFRSSAKIVDANIAQIRRLTVILTKTNKKSYSIEAAKVESKIDYNHSAVSNIRALFRAGSPLAEYNAAHIGRFADLFRAHTPPANYDAAHFKDVREIFRSRNPNIAQSSPVEAVRHLFRRNFAAPQITPPSSSSLSSLMQAIGKMLHVQQPSPKQSNRKLYPKGDRNLATVAPRATSPPIMLDAELRKNSQDFIVPAKVCNTSSSSSSSSNSSSYCNSLTRSDSSISFQVNTYTSDCSKKSNDNYDDEDDDCSLLAFSSPSLASSITSDCFTFHKQQKQQNRSKLQLASHSRLLSLSFAISPSKSTITTHTPQIDCADNNFAASSITLLETRKPTRKRQPTQRYTDQSEQVLFTRAVANLRNRQKTKKSISTNEETKMQIDNKRTPKKRVKRGKADLNSAAAVAAINTTGKRGKQKAQTAVTTVTGKRKNPNLLPIFEKIAHTYLTKEKNDKYYDDDDDDSDDGKEMHKSPVSLEHKSTHKLTRKRGPTKKRAPKP